MVGNNYASSLYINTSKNGHKAKDYGKAITLVTTGSF